MAQPGEGRLDQTAYEVAGAGPPVVLVHGLGMNRQMWDWQWPALTRSHQVLRYDLLGHGESAPPSDPVSMELLVDQLARLIDGLALGPCALVGFSLGGMIVRAFALAHPDKVSALAILASPHGRSEAERAAVLLRVEQAAQSGPGATVEAALGRWFSPAFAQRRPEVLAQVRDWILANDPAFYPSIYRVMAEGDGPLTQAVAAIDCPTLVLAFGDDQGNSPAMAAAMAALIPKARLEILPGLRHMGLAEDPAAVNGVLESFLTQALVPLGKSSISG